MLSIENLSYSTGKRNILQGINFKAISGTVTAIIGPNGAGKSTLLKQISQSARTYSGHIQWKNKLITGYPPETMALQRAVFSQKTNVEAGFDVQEVVMMGRYPYFKQHPGPQDHFAVSHAMQKLQIDTLAAQKYSLLSGGEQQRVHLARVMAQLDSPVQNKLLLLDEPLNNLDIRHQFQILELTRSFARAGNTVVIVLHDLQMALRFADYLLVLSNGTQAAFGKSSHVLDENLLSSVYQMQINILHKSGLDYPIIRFDSPLNENKKQYVTIT